MSAIDPTWLGTGLCIFSAVLYSCTNICLRAVVHCDPVWVSCIKVLPTALISGGMALALRRRGELSWPGPKTVLVLIGTSLLAQWAGNVVFQYALKTIGLALVVPLCFGTIILGGAVLGRLWLREPITPRSAVAMLVLIVSIAILSLGAGPVEGAAEAVDKPAVDFWHAMLGVAAACGSGLSFAWLGVVVRHMAGSRTSMPLTLFIIGLSGTVSLGLGAIARLGWSGLLATSTFDFATMFWGGTFNAVAFVALSKALKLAPIVQVNAVNASQIAMAALAGVLFFREPMTAPLAIGMALTVVGIALVDRGSPIERASGKNDAGRAVEDHGAAG